MHAKLSMFERLSSPVLLLIGTALAATTRIGVLAALLLLLSGPLNGLYRLMTGRRVLGRS